MDGETESIMIKVIKEFVKLVEENPTLPVIAMVDGDIIGADDYVRWLGKISSVELGEYTLFGDRFIDDRGCFEEEYYDSKEDELCEKFDYEPCICESTVKSGKYTQEEYERNCKNEEKLDAYLEDVAERAFQKAIILYIGVPNYENFDEEIL